MSDECNRKLKQLEESAMDVFGSKDKAQAWMRAPRKQFAGRTPYGHIVATGDLNAVEQELGHHSA